MMNGRGWISEAGQGCPAAIIMKIKHLHKWTKRADDWHECGTCGASGMRDPHGYYYRPSYVYFPKAHLGPARLVRKSK